MSVEEHSPRMACDVLTTVEMRGVVAMNGRGELCFFADCASDGLPLIGDDGRAMTSSLAHLPREILEATMRRVLYADLSRLDRDASSRYVP